MKSTLLIPADWQAKAGKIHFALPITILSLLLSFCVSASAENLMTINFESVPIQKAEGEETTVKGSMTFDLTTPAEDVSNDRRLRHDRFDFTNNQNAFVYVSVGDRHFTTDVSSDFRSDMQYRADIRQDIDHRTGGPGQCLMYFQYFEDERLTDENGLLSLGLHFRSQSCDGSMLPSGLPNSFNLFAWEDASVSLLYFEGGEIRLCTLDLAKIWIGDVNASRVSGSVFMDRNSDCKQDSDEPVLTGQIVQIMPGQIKTITNNEGVYSAYLPEGSYTASVLPQALWNNTCIDGTDEFEITSADQEIQASFAMEATELKESLEISVAAGRARPGFEIRYAIRIVNNGTLPYTGTVSFRHDLPLEDFNSTPAAASYTDSEALWHFNDFPIGATRVIRISAKLPADEGLIGSLICAHVNSESEAKSGDELLGDGADEICVEIRGAMDPNDIQVFSGTQNADGPITRDDKTLSYLIRFQNEGNESAITVRVLDALSEFHNLESIKIGAASHDFSFNFTDEGALEWTFNDIDLAPKSVDEAASQGFVKFEVRLKEELAIGTEIPNSAAIYFDFNSPVITNTVVSRLVNSVTSVTPALDVNSVRIYPNPSTDELTVRLEQPGAASLTLRNALGQTVLTKTVNSAVHELDLRNLSAGSYFLTIETAQGSLVKAVNVVR